MTAAPVTLGDDVVRRPSPTLKQEVEEAVAVEGDEHLGLGVAESRVVLEDHRAAATSA